MRNLCLLSPLALAAASGLAATAPRAQDGGFLSLPIARAERSRPLLNRRQSEDLAVPLYNISVLSYLIELSIGTPGQTVRVAVDTGSSELWVNPQCSTAQTDDQRQECETDGQYDPSQSSTYTDLSTGATITYGIGSAQIEYARDNVALPNSTIDLKNIQFGVATASEDLNEGILGLSFGNVSDQRDLAYSNFIDELQLQKVTESRAFSVALGPQDGHNEGVLIFGGVDTGKFVGPLRMIPILGPQGGGALWRYWVKLDSVGSTAGGSSHTYDGSATAVVLDTGSSLCTLPQTVVDGMTQDAGGSVDSNGNIIVPCALADSRNTFDFQFDNVTVRVPYGNLVIQADARTCILGVTPEANGSIALLGDTFLRSAYVVFDQTNMEIAVAPYADCGRHEQRIPAAGVRGIEGSCTSAATGTTASGTNAGSQSDAGPGPASSSSPSGGGDDADKGGSSAAPGWAVSWGLMASLGLLQLIVGGPAW